MGRAERLGLYVALTALTAFAVDGILPAMPLIEASFDTPSPLSSAQIVTTFVLGMAVGELIIGPISDAYGRRPAVIAGLVVFAAGTVVAASADSFGAVILGRLLQGIGVAGPKIGTRAMIRDRYAGADMARIMSVIFTLLILVPMFAPAVGAVITSLAGWRGVFWSYLTLAVGLGMWLWTRHPETLPAHKRVPLKPQRLWHNICAISGRLDVMGVVIATGFVFGAQLVYFSVAANLFGTLYDATALMPVYFALLATGTAFALLLNVWLVGRTGMEIPIFAGLLVLGISGAGLLAASAGFGGHPPLILLLCLAWIGFFALGLLFGNLNAFAMRPLGDLAGLGSSVIASGSSLVAFVFATLIEMCVDAPVWALACAFTLVAPLAAVCIVMAIPTASCKHIFETIRGQK